jgi:sigma-B regulation protein RsbQ
MDVQKRNNVKVIGHAEATRTIVFAHGFGCDQNMWRFLTPAFDESYRTILFDLVGCGNSAPGAYDFDKYTSLDAFADDLIEIIDTFATGPIVYVGHSVSATIGALAAIRAPEKFAALVMVGTSPSFINDGDYIGGFTRADIEELLQTLNSNYVGWASASAPAIMGAPEQPDLGVELSTSLCRTDPTIAAHFARSVFLSDNRSILPRIATPTLILQSSDDVLVPPSVGKYIQANIRDSVLQVLDNIGHCPHLSAPAASISATMAFLRDKGC